MRMEGILWKWTNYFSGWQPRWFVLDNGILSYYKSQEDVTNGCKGSLKIAVCDVMVSQTDISRMDLIIPGEQHFYLRASTPQERQQWLVALGSAKACLNYGKIKPIFEEIASDEVRQKKSELRLYCDLLMQQVHSVREAVQNPQNTDVQKLNEATSLLRATCDTFIHTLEECMTVANAQPAADGTGEGADPALPASPVRGLLVTNSKSSQGQIQRAVSVDRSNPSSGAKPRNQRNLHQAADIPLPRMKSLSESDSRDIEIDLSGVERAVKELKQRPRGRHNSDTQPRTFQTFFSNMSTRFCDVIPIDGDQVPTLPFIDACRNVLPLFDRMGPTAFSPLKTDISSNIKKIHERFTSAPVKYHTLQQIVLHDLENNTHQDPHSVALAVLWLKRAVEFIVEFLKELRISEDDLTEGVVGAYSRTLRPYHGWVLRGMFAVALRAIPDKPSLVRLFAIKPEDVDRPNFLSQLHSDIDQCLTAQEQLCKMLTDFLIEKGLDSDVQV